jgi:hypothetical protein
VRGTDRESGENRGPILDRRRAPDAQRSPYSGEYGDRGDVRDYSGGSTVGGAVDGAGPAVSTQPSTAMAASTGGTSGTAEG